MNKSLNLKCVVTGSSTVYAGNFLQSKIDEYGSEQQLIEQYVCKEVKAFLKKGYSIVDIRKLLNVSEEEDLPEKAIIEKLEKQYNKDAIKMANPSTTPKPLTDFTYNRSDDDVAQFMSTFILNKINKNLQ